MTRTSPQKKAKQLAKYFRSENPDYNYLKQIFRHLRMELEVSVDVKAKKLPYVPSEEEIHKYYKAVWETRNMLHMVLIKTLLYTGVRVSECVKIKIEDVNFDLCQIKIIEGKGKKDRIVPFPNNFKEVLALHANNLKNNGGIYLFESARRKPYTDRGIRKILASYSRMAGISRSISPHKLRHFLFTWLKRNGIEDALIQPYSGHESRQSLELYSKLSIADAQESYSEVMRKFPL